MSKSKSIHQQLTESTANLNAALAADKAASITVNLTVRLSPNFFQGLVDMKNIPAAQAAVKEILESGKYYPHELGIYVSDLEIDDQLVKKNLLNI